MERETPLISIIIVTYNHEKFIANSIDSIIKQEVDFKYELLICNDASSDKTNEILSSYKASYPDLIKVFHNESNEGPWHSANKTHQKCTGKYITWLDGDDYWTYDKKLQKQVDFLEANPEYIGCFHDAQIVTTPNDSSSANDHSTQQLLDDCDRYSQFNEYRSDFYPWHLLQRNIIPTASLVFRNIDNLSLFAGPHEVNLSLNWLLHLRIIKSSKFKYFDEPWSVYNDHPEGASKKVVLNLFKEANISILESLLSDEYYSKFKKGIYQSITNEYLQILLNPATFKESKKLYYKASINYLINSFKTAVHLSKYYRQSTEN